MKDEGFPRGLEVNEETYSAKGTELGSLHWTYQ